MDPDLLHAKIALLYKKGDPTLPENYRPITIIPLLYKLFAKMLYARLHSVLDEHQCPDQAGFRPNMSTTDHLFAFSMLAEKKHEYQIDDC